MTATAGTRTPTVLRAQGLTRVFGTGAGEVHALTDASLQVAAGELLVVRGPSGSGKTTLLNLLGGLDRPTAGSVWLGDAELTALGEKAVLAARRDRIGYVFQSFGLVPVLSAAENVEVPLRLRRTAPAERARRVADALEAVGLTGHARQRPYELSGGQQQRVGIARALVADPEVLLADEPTGQLDSGTAAVVMDLLARVVHERGVAAVVSTHDPELMARADRVVELRDGRVVRGEA
ncbi:ABC transporter ATP-binding protein [Promicromonospora thailandica]|uniref:ABC transport system ATP-binding protein n=1 Tax=Promicromonospora thailandica TaxID=765201 RepID=A0A9X2GAR9_9MICO|nr:ABC transporter ATP-binding protein [Promicromonospora thailandica]MCP2266229.1 putative ABC transport system ATP-binding protein [Promicromonospora thailandica]BFF20717.1 ABC transporter ATP-binding protein [Promicromonospora thailandica]